MVWCRPAIFDYERIVDVLEMRTDGDLVFLVVLVHHDLVSPYRSKVDMSLLVQVPPIKVFPELFRVELFNNRRVRILVVSFYLVGSAVLV